MKKLLIAAAIAAVTGCTGEIQIQGEGDVLSDDGLNCYLENNGGCVETVTTGFTKTLTAVPRRGSRFVGWDYCQSSTGNICNIDVDTETVQLGFNRDLPPIVAKFEKLPPLVDQYPVAVTYSCTTNLPYDRQCLPTILGRNFFRVEPSAGTLSWTYTRENGGGSSAIYEGQYTETADGFSFTGKRDFLTLMVVKAGDQITLSRIAPDWFITQTMQVGE